MIFILFSIISGFIYSNDVEGIKRVAILGYKLSDQEQTTLSSLYPENSEERKIQDSIYFDIKHFDGLKLSSWYQKKSYKEEISFGHFLSVGEGKGGLVPYLRKKGLSAYGADKYSTEILEKLREQSYCSQFLLNADILNEIPLPFGDGENFYSVIAGTGGLCCIAGNSYTNLLSVIVREFLMLKEGGVIRHKVYHDVSSVDFLNVVNTLKVTYKFKFDYSIATNPSKEGHVLFYLKKNYSIKN